DERSETVKQPGTQMWLQTSPGGIAKRLTRRKNGFIQITARGRAEPAHKLACCRVRYFDGRPSATSPSSSEIEWTDIGHPCLRQISGLHRCIMETREPRKPLSGLCYAKQMKGVHVDQNDLPRCVASC